MLKCDGVIQRVKQMMVGLDREAGRPSDNVRVMGRRKLQRGQHFDITGRRLWSEAVTTAATSANQCTGCKTSNLPSTTDSTRKSAFSIPRSRTWFASNTARRIRSAMMELLFLITENFVKLRLHFIEHAEIDGCHCGEHYPFLRG